MCPYTQLDQGSVKGYFSLNLESVRKDIKCMFGIMKKWWRILHSGLHYQDIRKCKKIFVACFCVHKFLIDIMEMNLQQCCHGGPININYGMWLDGHTPNNLKNSGRSWNRFSCRMSILSKHLRVFGNVGQLLISNMIHLVDAFKLIINNEYWVSWLTDWITNSKSGPPYHTAIWSHPIPGKW